MPATYDKDALHALILERALKFGDFTLASGQKSSHYLDGKQVALHAEGLRLISAGFLELAADWEYDAVGGMSIGADPLIGGVLCLSDRTDLVGAMIRKEAKGHGTGRYVEGPLQGGQRVLIVEDVVTTGGSSLKAIERLREFGAEICGVVAIVDRLQGGDAAFEAAGVPLKSLFTVRDFGIEPPAA
ncbi:orotate phosphoribosyltransferase [Alienimonas californiensis]|uniref:Orotate phosphoribosyltransferase n=1 Tax=Alienimonas californiensis TaxID=2527989 RepID=A0A517PBS9_9PLAN|nr:orotate phosphoribosyltransferase [Alienimonas californiensis]QDT16821.1 Orotate phosphoribosyltransferase [Alienimonas californiensis]